MPDHALALPQFNRFPSFEPGHQLASVAQLAEADREHRTVFAGNGLRIERLFIAGNRLVPDLTRRQDWSVVAIPIASAGSAATRT